MSEIEEVVKETLESAAEGGVTAVIALLVAVTATTMAICHIKDSNIVLAMNRVQTKTVDSWSYYQAKSTKQHLAENMLAQIRLQMEINPAAPQTVKASLEAAQQFYEQQAKKYEEERAEIKKESDQLEVEYEHLNGHHDLFDLAEAGFSVSLALYGIAALTRRRWLLFFAILVSGSGLLFGIGGFAGWSLHLGWLGRLLG